MEGVSTYLSSLSTREAVVDALYRFVTGLDTSNIELFDSALTDDATFDLNGRVMKGLEEIHTYCYDTISKLDTTHFLCNVRVDYKEKETTANMTATALAHHYPDAQGTVKDSINFVAGSLYSVHLVRKVNDELWQIDQLTLNVVWSEGDMSVIMKQ
ncbi:LAFE_0D00320g1_1 [Lachancea fermentati]|uniref:LAFE_0D00320g1_1 n=1 Tax=Lachancea fermentati TaxID=4955 RepID=A0A1G4MAL7_LACFM|nr:LAFE_0D00320g1_1 [Lachancea fermentati]